jgi:hypothetical protein
MCSFQVCREAKKGTPNLTYQSEIGTNITWWSLNLKLHQPYPTLQILNSHNQTKNLVHDDKHNPQAKQPTLNWHNQNPNITTVEMLMVLLLWLCSKVWESEFCYLWQQWTCHCVCSLVYIHITATKSKADWLLWLSISDNLYTCLMSHSFYINKPLNFLLLLHNSNNIWWQVQFMKLYIMQFYPISCYIQL